MENKEEQKTEKLDLRKEIEGEHVRGKILGGLLIVAIGVLFLVKELGIEMPFWLVSWKTLLIAVGLITVLKHKFRSAWGYTLMIIGGIFMAADFYPQVNLTSLLLPIGIIIVGLFIMIKPRKYFKHEYHQKHWRKWKNHYQYNNNWQKHHHHYYDQTEDSTEDFVTSFVYMGALKKNILSKTLKGGNIKTRFSGVELNLSQADFQGQIVFEIDQMFGGLELIIPAHWEVKSELSTGFSSVEDNRMMKPSVNVEEPKTLILRGSNYFGGIEIKNY